MKKNQQSVFRRGLKKTYHRNTMTKGYRGCEYEYIYVDYTWHMQCIK